MIARLRVVSCVESERVKIRFFPPNPRVNLTSTWMCRYIEMNRITEIIAQDIKSLKFKAFED